MFVASIAASRGVSQLSCIQQPRAHQQECQQSLGCLGQLYDKPGMHMAMLLTALAADAAHRLVDEYTDNEQVIGNEQVS